MSFLVTQIPPKGPQRNIYQYSACDFGRRRQPCRCDPRGGDPRLGPARSPTLFCRVRLATSFYLLPSHIAWEHRPKGFTQKLLGSTGSRTVICPAMFSPKPYLAKMRKAIARRCFKYLRSSYGSSNLGGEVNSSAAQRLANLRALCSFGPPPKEQQPPRSPLAKATKRESHFRYATRKETYERTLERGRGVSARKLLSCLD